MGFFSFLTADKKESIPAQSNGNWFLLSPTNEPIKLTYYDGYGHFLTELGQEISIYQYLAVMNVPGDAMTHLTPEQVESLGVSLDCGALLENKDGKVYACSVHTSAEIMTVLGIDLEVLFDNFLSEIEVDGIVASVNEHIENMRLIKCDFPCKYPLKITSELAEYSEVEASANCPAQGYFY